MDNTDINWQHRSHKTQDEDKQSKTPHNMCWTQLHANKHTIHVFCCGQYSYICIYLEVKDGNVM